jgi:hypothetical protein
MVKPGEEIIADKNQHFRVLHVVPFEEEDESPFVGLLQVEAAWKAEAASRTPSRLPVAAPASEGRYAVQL